MLIGGTLYLINLINVYCCGNRNGSNHCQGHLIFVRSVCPADLTKVNDLVVKEESDTETDKSESAESAAEPEVKCEKCV